MYFVNQYQGFREIIHLQKKQTEVLEKTPANVVEQSQPLD